MTAPRDKTRARPPSPPGRGRADDRARAFELHMAGATYQTIADTLGFASKATAYRLVQEAIAELGDPATPPPKAAGRNAVAIARLDAMLAGLWPKARKGDVQAVDRVLRIEERRALLEAQDHAAAAAAEPVKETGLSDFEKRLAERRNAATPPRRRRSS